MNRRNEEFRFLPCPRCGSKLIELESFDRQDEYFRCYCENDHSWDEWCGSEQNAVDAWNERPRNTADKE